MWLRAIRLCGFTAIRLLEFERPMVVSENSAITGRAVPDDFGHHNVESRFAHDAKHRQGGQPRRERFEKSALTPPVRPIEGMARSGRAFGSDSDPDSDSESDWLQELGPG